MAEGANEDEGQRRADDEPCQRAESGQHHDLRQIDGEHIAAVRTPRLERCDDIAAAVDVAFDGIADADAAHQQGREPDQRQELRESQDGSLKLWRGPVRSRRPASAR